MNNIIEQTDDLESIISELQLLTETHRWRTGR